MAFIYDLKVVRHAIALYIVHNCRQNCESLFLQPFTIPNALIKPLVKIPTDAQDAWMGSTQLQVEVQLLCHLLSEHSVIRWQTLGLQLLLNSVIISFKSR